MIEKLGKYYNVISGFAFKSSDLKDNADIPIIKIGNISNGRNVIIENMQYVDHEFLNINEKYHIKNGDVLISLTGSHINQPNSMVGRVCRNYDKQTYLLNQRAGKIIAKENASTDYMFYALLTKAMKESIVSRAYGAANQVNVSPSAIMGIKWNFPTLPTQQKIASILSSYDRLIENNTRRIRLLEQMAENLYKEWFVRFRFPEHEKVEMVNGLPKGWERTKLIKNIKTSSGGTPSRNKGEYYKNGTIPWIKTGELQDCILINTEECITEDAVNNSSAKLFPKGTLLMAMYGVNVGKLGISEIEATCNQACCVFTPKQIDYKYYLFHYLKSIREYLLSISFGAAQQNLSQELIKSIRVLFPDEKTNISFVKEVEPLFKEISIIQQQNQLLTRQRDLLLPRLMSGKLEVKS